MISKELKEKLLKTQMYSEFSEICKENDLNFSDFDNDILKHFKAFFFHTEDKKAVLYKDGVYYDYRLKERNNEN